MIRSSIDRAIKRRWHDELVAHPTTHAWVLNLYRAGEHHPATVDDYFPVAHAPAGLDERLARHREQEAMHARLYAAAVKKRGGEVEDFTGLDVFNVAIRAQTSLVAPGATVRITDDDDDDAVADKLAHFFAHAHFLEARIARSLEVHIDACARAGQDDVAKAVALVHADEVDHVAYTKDAVFAVVSRARATEILEVHRVGEARANLAFSARQVRQHLRRHDVGAGDVLLWRFCAFLMESAVNHV